MILLLSASCFRAIIYPLSNKLVCMLLWPAFMTRVANLTTRRSMLTSPTQINYRICSGLLDNITPTRPHNLSPELSQPSTPNYSNATVLLALIAVCRCSFLACLGLARLWWKRFSPVTPLVYGADELAYVFDSFRSLPSVIGISQPPMECVPQLSRDHIREVAAVHLERLRKIDVDAKRVTNTLPDNYLLLGFIRMLFPNATLIHCRRDLRDVAVSCWIKHFHNVPWSHDRTHIASRINEYQRVINHWNDLLAGEILEVNYEDLVQNPEAVSQQLIDLCGLGWDSSCLADNHRQRDMQACDETQARQVLTTRSIARFSGYESHLADLFAAIDQ